MSRVLQTTETNYRTGELKVATNSYSEEQKAKAAADIAALMNSSDPNLRSYFQRTMSSLPQNAQPDPGLQAVQNIASDPTVRFRMNLEAIRILHPQDLTAQLNALRELAVAAKGRGDEAYATIAARWIGQQIAGAED
jgi:hypothetical protein